MIIEFDDKTENLDDKEQSIYSAVAEIYRYIKDGGCKNIVVKNDSGKKMYALDSAAISFIKQRDEKSSRHTEAVHSYCSKGEYEKACEEWNKLFDLYDASDKEKQNETLAVLNSIQLQTHTSRLTDDEVYAVTDMLKRKYYASFS